MRFIHLNESGGVFDNSGCKCDDDAENSDAQKVRPTASGGFPACPKCGLDYGHCRCPKIVEEKIDRKILFDYAKDGERSPLHEGGKM